MAAKTVSDGLTRISPGEKSERRELLAVTIEQACDALKKILGSGLNRKAIVVLVHDSIPKPSGWKHNKMTRKEVEQVIDALEGLAAKYCR